MYGRGLQIRRTGRLRRSRSVRRRVGKERAFAPLLSRGSGSGICSVPAGSDDGLLWAARGCIRRGCPLRRCSGQLEGTSAIKTFAVRIHGAVHVRGGVFRNAAGSDKEPDGRLGRWPAVGGAGDAFAGAVCCGDVRGSWRGCLR